MKKLSFVISVLALLLSLQSIAQKELTREAYVRFYSSTAVEDIEAVSNQASSVIDKSTGALAFQVLMRSFTFEKALMQEHFNENYVESEDYPMASFKGEFEDLDEVDFDTDGTYETTVSGTFEVHGVAQERVISVTVTVKDGKLKLESTFNVAPADHDIEIPSLVSEKIASEVEVTVKAQYQPYER